MMGETCPTCGVSEKFVDPCYCSDGFHAPGETYWPTPSQSPVGEELKALPCPKCGFEWSPDATPEEVCHHTAYGSDGGAEYIVICGRCRHDGELKARPEWAVEAWNRLTRPTVDLGEDRELSRMVKRWDDTSEFSHGELYFFAEELVEAARARIEALHAMQG